MTVQKSGFTFRRKANDSRSEGFTLIELLIVISIIAILAALGLDVYNSVYRSGRDAKRQSDLKVIQSALQEYNAGLHYYPQMGSGSCSGSNDGLLRFDCALKSPGGTRTYLGTVPQESFPPLYCYKALKVNQTCDSVLGFGDCNNSSANYSDRCNSYCLYARLENPSSGSTDKTCGNAKYNLVVGPP